MFGLISGDSFRIKSQKVTGHVDMGIIYTYKIQSKNFSALDDYISKNLAKIKAELSQDYIESFDRKKTDFYFDKEKQFYIGGYELQTLMKTQGLLFKKYNIGHL